MQAGLYRFCKGDKTVKTETFTATKITADEGKILTNGEIYGKVIFLGYGDSADNYREIPIEEYEELQKAKENDAEQWE